MPHKCGNSSVGRAQPCQGWGREFESRFPLQNREALVKAKASLFFNIISAIASPQSQFVPYTLFFSNREFLRYTVKNGFKPTLTNNLIRVASTLKPQFNRKREE